MMMMMINDVVTASDPDRLDPTDKPLPQAHETTNALPA
jgi:hypothetical protein